MLEARHERQSGERSARARRARPARPSRRSRGLIVAIPTSAARAASSASRSGGVRKTPRSVPAGAAAPPPARSARAGRPSATRASRRRRASASRTGPGRRPGQSGSPLRSPASAAASICSSRMQAWTRSGSSPRSSSARYAAIPAPEALLERQRARVVDRDDAEPDEVAAQARGSSALVALRRGRRRRGRSRAGPRSRGGRRSARRPSSRRMRPPSGSAVSRPMPAAASAARLTQSEWWSWAQIATRRPGTTRLEVVGGRPAPEPVRVPAVALDPVAVRRAASPAAAIAASAVRERRRPATGRPCRGRCRPRRGGGARRSGPGSRPRRGRARTGRVNGSARVSRSTAEPAKATRPPVIPTASTQPNPRSPASVAIRPVTRASSGIGV